jgi:hypothetical protein
MSPVLVPNASRTQSTDAPRDDRRTHWAGAFVWGHDVFFIRAELTHSLGCKADRECPHRGL